MNCRTASIIFSAFLALSPLAEAQSFFALPEVFPQSRQTSRMSFEYDIDFEYNADLRNYNACKEIISSNRIVNNVKVTPTIGMSIQQNRNVRHSVMTGINVMKDLGGNPMGSHYVEEENKETLKNLSMFNKMLLYYGLEARTKNGMFEAKAGIFPAKSRSGYYSRAIFSDIDRIYNSEIEGAMIKYENRRFIGEAGFDCTSSAAVERLQGYNAFTSGEYSPVRWAAIGWSGSYTTVRPSLIEYYDVDNAMFNPYLKFDLGYLLKMQELSVRAGGLMSYQVSRLADNVARTPMGAEAVMTVKNWGFGIEDDFYYGDNLMPFRSRSYMEQYRIEKYKDLIYRGEDNYFTQRGYASIYNRVELFYQPEISEFFSFKASAVAHFITGSADIQPFVGWQAKLSAVFNLNAFRKPSERFYGQPAKKAGRKQNGPSYKL